MAPNGERKSYTKEVDAAAGRIHPSRGADRGNEHTTRGHRLALTLIQFC